MTSRPTRLLATAAVAATAVALFGTTASAADDPAPSPDMQFMTAGCTADRQWVTIAPINGADDIRLASNNNRTLLAAKLNSAPGYISNGRMLTLVPNALLKTPVELMFFMLRSGEIVGQATVTYWPAGNSSGTYGRDIMVGDGRTNYLSGDTGQDVLCGLGGHDTMRGGDGDDILLAGAGNDNAQGGNGNDSVYGEAGSDFLAGDAGDDNLFDGPTSDASVNDMLEGGPGADALYAFDGSDRISGGDGPDVFTMTPASRVSDFELGERVAVVPVP